MVEEPIRKFVEEIVKLPGIGKKTAMRLAFHILKMPAEEVKALSSAIADLKDKIRFCSSCFNITDSELCRICSDPGRDRKTICVVEEPSNILPIEQSGHYKGLYHVLMGSISPIQGIGPEDLKVRELIKRLKGGEVSEVIIATNPNVEGEATSVYLSKLIKPLGPKVSRIAVGLPVGSDLEYIDEVTMSKALDGRRDL
ncbi:MAG: recombination mediator RecR [Acidobacteriota bacterium]